MYEMLVHVKGRVYKQDDKKLQIRKSWIVVADSVAAAIQKVKESDSNIRVLCSAVILVPKGYESEATVDGLLTEFQLIDYETKYTGESVPQPDIFLKK